MNVEYNIYINMHTQREGINYILTHSERSVEQSVKNKKNRIYV
jgi:hypothetical protein